MPPTKKLTNIIIFLLLSSFIFISTPAFCDENPIAQLTSFSGTVLIKSLGKWAAKPEINLPLYSQDKVVTRVGTALITFFDGATVEIKKNSNLLIQEREEEKGIIKKAKMVKRRILLFMGKMFFKTGTGEVQTQFETEKTVIGIRGTQGILSIGEDGEIYVEFTEGGAKFIVGEYLDGVAKDVSQKGADASAVQIAAYKAYLAFEKCKEAESKAAKGEISPVQAEWACAKAREMAALEIQTWAESLIENNPYPEVVEWAEDQIEEAEILREEALEDMERAEDEGAIPYLDEYKLPGEEGYEPPEAEAFEPAEPEPGIFDIFQETPIQDSEAVSTTGAT